MKSVKYFSKYTYKELNKRKNFFQKNSAQK
jgi:hypothetical protein